MVEELKNKGNEAFRNKRYSEAVEFYSKAIELEAYSAILFTNRSVAHASLGEYSKALRDAERAIAVDSYWVKGWLRKAEAHEHLGQFEEAISAYSKGVEKDIKDKRCTEGILRLAPMCMAKMDFSNPPKNGNKDKKQESGRVKDAIVLMASADEKQQLKGLNVLNLGMLHNGMNYIQEIEQYSTHVFDMLYNFISPSASAPNENEVHRVASIVVLSVGMMQVMLKGKLNTTIVKILRLMLQSPHLSIRGPAIEALYKSAFNDEELSNLLQRNQFTSAEQLFKEGFIDPLISLLKVNDPKEFEYIQCYAAGILGRIGRYTVAGKEIVNKGGLEVLTKVAITKRSGLEGRFETDVLGLVVGSAADVLRGVARQDLAVDALWDLSGSPGPYGKPPVLNPEASRVIIRLGGVKLLVDSITIATKFDRIVVGVRHLASAVRDCVDNANEYGKLFVKQITFEQCWKLLTIGDDASKKYYTGMALSDSRANEEVQLHLVKANACQLASSLCNFSKEFRQKVRDSKMLHYFITMVHEQLSEGGLYAVAELAKYPSFAQHFMKDKQLYGFQLDMMFLLDEDEWTICITFSLKAIACYTEYADFCFHFLGHMSNGRNVMQALAGHSRNPDRIDYIARIFENLGGPYISTVSILSRKPLADSLAALIPDLPPKVKEKAIETARAFMSGIPHKKKDADVADAQSVKKLRVCALPSCTHIENENEKFKLCGRCMALAYCSVECQKVHWKLQHGKVCIPAAAAKK